MNARITLLFAGLAAAGLGGLAVYYRQQGREQQAAAETDRATLAGLQAEQKRLAARLNETEQRRASLGSALAQTRGGKPAPSSVPAKSPAPPPNPADVLAKNPDLQLKFLAAQRVQLARRYGPFERGQHLSPEQTQQFQDLLLKRVEQQQDLDAIARQQGASPEIAALRAKAQDEFTQAAGALLGGDAAGQLKDYERAVPVREMVERLAGAAVVVNAPLAPDQAEKLVGIFSAASAGYDAGAVANPMRIDWARVDADAAKVLTPEQLAMFQQIEPIGGGASRWMSILSQRMEEAKKSAGGAEKHGLDTLGKSGPGP